MIMTILDFLNTHWKAIIGFAIGWKILWYFLYYLSTTLDNIACAKMKWSTVKKLYPINPEKWTYNDNSYHNNGTVRLEHKFMQNLRYNETPILLSFFGYQQLRHKAKKVGEEYGKQALEYVLTDVQKDIEREREKAQKEIERAKKMMLGEQK